MSPLTSRLLKLRQRYETNDIGSLFRDFSGGIVDGFRISSTNGGDLLFSKLSWWGQAVLRVGDWRLFGCLSGEVTL